MSQRCGSTLTCGDHQVGFRDLKLSVIRSLNIVKDARNFRSIKYNTFWHLRLQLGIQSTDVALKLRVDHYLCWTLALFHLILLLGSYYTLYFSYILVIILILLII